MKIEELIKTCLQKGIYVTGVNLDKNGNLSYTINGFSKSGTAEISEEDGKIICSTRYDTKDEIEDFDDLAYVAFRWNKNYIDRGYGWNYQWAPIFVENGWLKKEVKEITTYKVV